MCNMSRGLYELLPYIRIESVDENVARLAVAFNVVVRVSKCSKASLRPAQIQRF